ncbi:RHS repeat-associated core domain-containing protein [Acinetobacter rudis]|uniref:RHS repeat-associated core domain-containing protein n=1 Tax=Acinetobacter rudis TaxID=632955 RepID=UPI003341D1B0
MTVATVTLAKDIDVYKATYQSAKTRVNTLLQKNIHSSLSVDPLISVIRGLPALGFDKPEAQNALKTLGEVVSVFFPIVDVVEDVLNLYNQPSNIGQWIIFAIDVLAFVPLTMGVGRSLKLAVHTARPAILKSQNLSAACKKAIDSIIAIETIVLVDQAIDTIISKLNQCEQEISLRIKSIVNGLIGYVDTAVINIGKTGAAKAQQQVKKIANEQSKYELASPSEWFSAKTYKDTADAASLAAKRSGAEAKSGVLNNQYVVNAGEQLKKIWTTLRPQFVKLTLEINAYVKQAINGKNGIAAILKILKEFLSVRKKAGNQKINGNSTVTNTNGSATASRKIQEGEAKGNANNCDCSRTTGSNARTGRSITYALGTEIFSHQDFNLASAELLGLRTYSSYLSHLDQGVFGARWITPINKALQFKQEQWEYLQADGRIIKFPDTPIGHSYYHSLEDIELQRISDEIIVLKYLDRTEETYKKQGDYYQLQLLESLNGQQYEFYYDHLRQGQYYLSDIIVKSGDRQLYHIGTELGISHKIEQMWLLQDQQKIRKLAEYQYDRSGDLIKAKNENGESYQYQYQNHLVTRYTDLTGRGVNLKWDGHTAEAKAIHEWADDGSDESRLEWSEHIRATSVYDALNNETVHYYTENGYTYRTIYPDGLEEWFIRDINERVVQHIQTNGATINYEYDKKGNLLKLINEEGVAIYYGYDDDNNLTHIRDGEGHIWQREYDQQGNLTAEIDPIEGKTQYQYNPMGLPISIQDAKGGVKQLSYNGQGQLTQYVDCSGKATQWQYDERGRLKQTVNALNEMTQYKYTELRRETVIAAAKEQLKNAVGQLEQVIHADGTIEHFVHDAEGRLLQHTDAQGQITKYLYNASGLISQRIDSMNKTVKYQWDKLGRLSKLINENGASYSFHYDAMGRLLREVDFDGKETVYHYEQASGNLQRSIELVQATQTTHLPRHRVQEFEFDSMGRLTQRTAGFSQNLKNLILEPEDNQEPTTNAVARLEQALTEEFAYDGNGQLIQAKNSHSRIQFFYNEVGNLSHEHHHDLKTQQTAVWKHLYDELNNRITTYRPDGQKVDWLLYGSGHVYGLSLGGEDTVSFKRDDLHREIERHYVNGLSQEQRYDKVGRLIRQNIKQDDEAGYQTPSTSNAQKQTTELLRRLYHYDKVGQLTDIHDKRRGHIEYKYDPVGRLLQANSALGKETFAFDPASNIINPNKQYNIRQQDTYFEPIHQNIGYNHLVNNVVKDYLNQKYMYDEFGQLVRQIESDVLYFEWDALGRLIRSKNSDQETHYRYDALGRRIEKAKQKVRRQGMTETTHYGWDGDTLAYESTSQYTKHYVYEKDSFIPLIQATYRQQIKQHQTPQWSHGYDYEADPLWHEVKQAEKFDRVWFYHCDHLGTPQEMSDQTGAIVWTAQYKAWGECRSENHVKRDIWDSEIITNNIRFQGQYFDEETGLHYNRYRYYSPYVGRFISKDPIGLLGGFNVYAYAQNSIQWTDALGLTPSQILDKNLGGVVGDKMQAHHLIPVAVWKVYDKKFFQKIGMSGDRDKASNGELIPDSCKKAQSMRRRYYHCGSHTIYSGVVTGEVNKIYQDFDQKRITAQQAKDKIQNLQKDLRIYVSQSASTPTRLK